MIKGIVTDKLDYCLDAIFNVGIEEEHNIYGCLYDSGGGCSHLCSAYDC